MGENEGTVDATIRGFSRSEPFLREARPKRDGRACVDDPNANGREPPPADCRAGRPKKRPNEARPPPSLPRYVAIRTPRSPRPPSGRPAQRYGPAAERKCPVYRCLSCGRAFDEIEAQVFISLARSGPAGIGTKEQNYFFFPLIINPLKLMRFFVSSKSEYNPASILFGSY
jgi:hypothetical protein